MGWSSLSRQKQTEVAPSLPLRSLQGQGGVFDFGGYLRALGKSKSPPCRKRRDKDGAPSLVRAEKVWASSPGASGEGSSGAAEGMPLPARVVVRP